MADESDTLANALGEQDNAFGDASLKKPLLRKCANPNCNKVFKPVRYWQRFHSVKCRNDEYWSRHKRITVPSTTNQET